MKDYKNITFKGSTFPDDPYKKVKVLFTDQIMTEYIPAVEKLNLSKGMKLLLIIMASKEGFYPGTRSYKNNNPGNIGNTDSGANQKFDTLELGILEQKIYVESIISGKHKAYPVGKLVKIKPFYSAEVAKNQKTYGFSPYLPGYEFTFTGQLDQFVKIYSTGARVRNGYLNIICSFFKNHGIDINPESKLSEIVKIN